MPAGFAIATLLSMLPCCFSLRFREASAACATASATAHEARPICLCLLNAVCLTLRLSAGSYVVFNSGVKTAMQKDSVQYHLTMTLSFATTE